jgi:hypothetical protein
MVVVSGRGGLSGDLSKAVIFRQLKRAWKTRFIEDANSARSNLCHALL